MKRVTTHHSIALAVAAALCAACANSREPDGAAPGADPTAPPTSNALPPTEQVVINPLVTELFSNAPDRVRLQFALEVRFGSAEAHRAVLEPRMAFLAKDGRKIGAQVEVVEPKLSEHGLGHRFDVLPREALAPDTWHSLSVSTDAALAVKVEDGLGLKDGGWSVPFFTGSAPQVSRIEWSTKSADRVYVQLSEPVELQSLVASGLVKAGTANLSVCVELGGKCAGPSDTPALDGLEIRLTQPLKDVSGVAVVLPELAMGSGRTVKDGALAAGLPLTGKTLVFPSADVGSSPCQSGHATCFHNRGPAD